MNVLVIGDSCRDVFVKGRVDRLCPEAPVPVINPVDTEENPGMAGNVNANVKSLRPNASVAFVTQTADISKTRYVDTTSGYILLRVDENDKTTTPLTYQRLDSYFIENCIHPKYFDIVLISDYNKGFLTEEVMQKISEVFNHYGVPTFLDTKKVLGDWSKLIDFVKINEKEYKEQLRSGDPIRFCRHLIVTMGAMGSVYKNTGQRIPSDKVEVMDVSGAGDTYFAAFALRYKETGDILQAMTYANKASAVAVSKHGVVAVKQSEIT